MSSNTKAVQSNSSRVSVRIMVQIAMLAAVAGVLMLIEVPLGFAPPFYKLDLSEVPVLIGCFSMGPMAGATIELVKILINFILNGTTTAGVGEFANLLIGCSIVVPAGIIYRKMTTRRGALIGMITGTLCMTIAGAFLNAYLLLPTYARVFGMPIEGLIEMGTAVNSSIDGMLTFILLAVVPFNLLKGAVVTTVTMLVYKKISPILKN